MISLAIIFGAISIICAILSSRNEGTIRYILIGCAIVFGGIALVLLRINENKHKDDYINKIHEKENQLLQEHYNHNEFSKLLVDIKNKQVPELLELLERENMEVDVFYDEKEKRMNLNMDYLVGTGKEQEIGAYIWIEVREDKVIVLDKEDNETEFNGTPQELIGIIKNTFEMMYYN